MINPKQVSNSGKFIDILQYIKDFFNLLSI